MKKIANLVDLIDRFKQLRGDYQRSEAKFLLFVMEAEVKFGFIWKATGVANFSQFLKSNHICDTGRYEAFVEGMRRSSVEKALSYGADWIVQLGKVQAPSKKAIEEFVKKTDSFVQQNNTPPRLNTIREMKREVFKAANDTKKNVTTRGRSVTVNLTQRLTEENKRLREENMTLTQRCQQLEAELAKYQNSNVVRRNRRIAA